MFDLDVLTICSDSDKYERFEPYIKEHALSPECWQVFKDMKEWFSKHDTMDWVNFRTWFKFVKHSSYKDSTSMVYDLLFKRLETHIVNADLEKELVGHLIGRDYATRIADKALAVAEGSEKISLDDVIVLVNDYELEVDRSVNLDNVLVTSDIHEIIAATTGAVGYNWRLSNLQESLGPLRQGDFIVVGARPDSGKTSFLASEATNFMSQLPEGKKVLWFNNEESGAKVRGRTIQAGCDWPQDLIVADPLGAKERFEKECGPIDNLVIVDDAGMPAKIMEQVIKRHNAGLIIFDQLWKVPGFSKEAPNEVARQTMLFNWGREMAKKYAPVITVHQAGGSGGGERWLPMEALYGSQTGIQGEADAIIMIGRSYEQSENDLRFFFIPKNKMYGKTPEYRNGRFIATINVDTGRFVTDGTFEIA